MVFPDPYKRAYELRQRQGRIHEETNSIRRRNIARMFRNGFLTLLGFLLIRFIMYYVNLVGSGLRGMTFNSGSVSRVIFDSPPRGKLYQVIEAENRTNMSRTALGRRRLKKLKTFTETDWLNALMQGISVGERGGKLTVRISKQRPIQCRVTTQRQGRRFVAGWFDHRPKNLPLWKIVWNVGVHGDPGFYTADFELPCEGNFIWECRSKDGASVRMRWNRN